MNYFGKTLDTSKEFIEITPILIHKGESKIALYGLGNLKESFFKEIWNNKKLRFLKPENFKEYFNILLLHQNPINLQPNSESSFINLIIWGAEIESQPQIDFDEEIGWNIYKPGSSLITCFNEIENKPKHLGILNIRRNEFQFEPIFLKDSRRELLVKEIEMKSLRRFNNPANVEENKKSFKGFEEDEAEHLIEEEIAGLLKEFHSRVFDREVKKLPLIRLRVEYSGFDIIRIQRLENKFKNKVANEGYY